jgi:Tfp pilus assembly protein PilZ
MYASRDSVLKWIDDSATRPSGIQAAPATVEAHLGVLSELRLIAGAGGALTGVFVPMPPTLPLGARVLVTLRLGVASEQVSGMVAWARDAAAESVRARRGVGVTFPVLTDAQRRLLERAQLLHETTVIPQNATHVYELALPEGGDDAQAKDFELKLVGGSEFEL